ncbi:MAG: PPC domain-containing protein [Bacteroidota bacterium]
MKRFRPIHFLVLSSMPILAGLVAMSIPALGAGPYLAYVYPAGGQQGATFSVTIGGQSLRGVTAAVISGDGVKASVAGYVPAGGPLNVAQQDALGRMIDNLIGIASGKKNKEPVAGTVRLPDLPDLRNLDQKTVQELRELKDKYLNRKKRPQPPMAEEVTLQITIDAKASPGNRELRLLTANGFSNPVVFQIDSLPEFREPEASVDKSSDHLSATLSGVPVVLNGQIMPGDVDRYSLPLRRGQKLIALAYARTLIPYLADAVPGWFQAVLALYDAEGRELAYVDDCGYDPDPVLTFEVPEDGRYLLEIRDSIYRGRRDFVYRIAVGDASLLQAMLPSGSRGGVQVGGGKVKNGASSAEAHPFPSWSSLPMVAEKEPNDTGRLASALSLPQTVRGSISRAGDIDYYRFTGKAGDEIVAEVLARRTGSPLDSLLRLVDANGTVLAWNDDSMDKSAGLLTHHADSYIRYRLPVTGTYTLQVSDAQRHGGEDYTYSLRISPPMPDFALWVSPSASSIATGNTAVITVDVLRADGWDGEIEVALKGAPAGYFLGGAKIPPGRDQIRMTLTKPVNKLEHIQLEGRAVIGGKTITRPVQPADRMMQAFAYYHLVPSANSKIAVIRNSKSAPSMSLSVNGTIQIPAGKTVEVRCTIAPMPTAPVRLELREPPAGVFLKETRWQPDGPVLVLAADGKYTGYADNLIVEAFIDTETPGKDGGPATKKKVSIGVLPAIPIKIVP